MARHASQNVPATWTEDVFIQVVHPLEFLAVFVFAMRPLETQITELPLFLKCLAMKILHSLIQAQ